MQLGVLVVLQMAADTAKSVDQAQQLGDSEGGVVEWLAVAGIGDLIGRIDTAAGKDQDAAGRERRTSASISVEKSSPSAS